MLFRVSRQTWSNDKSHLQREKKNWTKKNKNSRMKTYGNKCHYSVSSTPAGGSVQFWFPAIRFKYVSLKLVQVHAKTKKSSKISSLSILLCFFSAESRELPHSSFFVSFFREFMGIKQELDYSEFFNRITARYNTGTVCIALCNSRSCPVRRQMNRQVAEVCVL